MDYFVITNFMIRDARMQELVGKEKEPITPFIDKVRQLYNDYQELAAAINRLRTLQVK